ncbi:MAG: ABC transporter ATP-binding protein [Bacilli bacterium]
MSKKGMNPPEMNGGEKAKDFKKVMKRIFNYSNKYLPVVIVALICAIIGTILMLLGPNKLSDLTDLIKDGIMGTIDIDGVTTICITLVVFYGVSWLLSAIQGWILAGVTQKITYKLRDDISHKINRVPLSYYNKVSTGDILSKVSNDADTIGQSLNNSIGTLVTSITLLVGSVIMMFITNVILALTAIVSSLLGFVFMLLIMKKSQKHFNIQQEAISNINAHVEEVYSGHTIVKAYNDENDVKEKFNNMNDLLQKSAFKAQSYSGLMMPIMSFIGNFGYVAVCIVGALLAMNGYISFGVIVAFMMYVRYFTQPLSQIAQATQSLQSAAAAGERVFDFLDEKEMEDESYKTTKLDKVHGDVTFKDVKFGYDNDKTIINDFSVNVKSGNKIAIVGPTGAGKTTLVNLLMRFYEVNSGSILIDGVSTKELKRENVHDKFCMVLQDTWLFEGTVRENLVYSEKNVTDEDIDKACDAVGISHFINTLPNGYDTILSESSSLSAGQKQQLTIARAMISNRPMLILDEATSSVDTRTELKIQDAMDKLMSNRTSFVIAHRLSTIKNADLILVLKDGDIIEKGTHESLLKLNGFYSELYNSQFTNND